MLADMGFTSAQARKALKETVRFVVLTIFIADHDVIRRAEMPNARSNGCSTILMTQAKRLHNLLLTLLRVLMPL